MVETSRGGATRLQVEVVEHDFTAFKPKHGIEMPLWTPSAERTLNPNPETFAGPKTRFIGESQLPELGHRVAAQPRRFSHEGKIESHGASRQRHAKNFIGGDEGSGFSQVVADEMKLG